MVEGGDTEDMGGRLHEWLSMVPVRPVVPQAPLIARAASAVSKGFCGIDIQKVTDRVIKVRQRFCTPNEEEIVASFFRASFKKQSALLTRLWAAKEALRKVANRSSLPGFLELELIEINKGPPHNASTSWKFVFIWKHIDTNGRPDAVKCSVAITHLGDYALALTTRNDTVG